MNREVNIEKNHHNPYRFGFNGKENINDWDGKMGTYDFDARLLNTLTGRWNSPDKLEGKFPNMSTYGFVGNNPIIAIDPNGKDIYIVIHNTTDGKEKIQKSNVQQIIGWLGSSDMGNSLIQEYIKNPDKDIYITFGNIPPKPDGTKVPGVMHRKFDNAGNIMLPETVDIGGKHHVTDTELDGFNNVIIDANKENYFIILNQDEYGKKSLLYNDKEGAKTIGHEIGAHTKNKKTSGDKEHVIWGQDNLTVKETVGSSAESLNNQINASKNESDKYQLKDTGRGKFKLEEKP